MHYLLIFFFFSSRRRHTRYWRDWSSDVCSSDLALAAVAFAPAVNAASAAAPVKLTLTSGQGDIPTADPALTSDTSSAQIVTVTHTSLIRADETDLSKPMIPALASKWTTSADGKTITFHIRKDISWVKRDASKRAVVQ